MSQEQQHAGRSVGSWLSLGVLVLLVVGLVRLSAGNQPVAEPAEPSPSPFTALELASPSPTPLASPVPTELSSPLPASFASPLPAGLNSPLPSPSPLPPTPPSPAEVDGFQLTVLHSNDTWGYLLPCGWNPPVGGVARRATVINQERAKSESVLVLDAGDALANDRDPARRTQGESSVAAMNLLGYDAMVLGAKDLALGLEVLRQRLAEADFAVLSANAVVSATGELLAPPYVMRPFDGHRIAIVGLSGESGTAEITLLDPLETARAVVADVSTQADVIILLSHAGALVDQQIAQTVPGIDLIISGGELQTESPWWDAELGTLILHADVASPGHAGRQLGIAWLTFDDDGRLVAQSWERLALGPEVADDAAMSNWVTQQR